MALPQIGTKAEPQIIPTNAGLRTFAAPPQALQENIVPNDLFYIRNHWTDSPEIDINTFQLKAACYNMGILWSRKNPQIALSEKKN